MRPLNRPLSIALALACLGPARADTASPQAVVMTAPIAYESGDTWSAQGKRYRLYGAQACIRGTPYMLPDGREGDCGEASLRMLAAMMATLKVSCTPVATGRDAATIVVCAGQSGDKPLDLAAAMIVSGYAFSAETPAGAPVEAGYYASELRAQSEKAGLWATKSFTHPVKMLSQIAKQPATAASPALPSPPRPAMSR